MDWFNRIADWALVAPDRPAHVSEGRVLTYGALVDQARSLAAGLTATLPDDRSPIAIVGHKEPEILVGFLGAALARHPYVPIDDGTPPARGQRIRERAHVSTTLTTRDVATLVRSHAPGPWRTPDPADTCYIMFTSGSTGEPNGVMIPWACLTSFVTWLNGEQGFAEQQEVFLNQVVFSFDVSVMDLYPSLSTGGTLLSLDAERHRRFQAPVSRAERGRPVTVWVSTPSFARLCLAEPSSAFDAARRATIPSRGETLDAGNARQLLDAVPGCRGLEHVRSHRSDRRDHVDPRHGRPDWRSHAVLPVGPPSPVTSGIRGCRGRLDALADGDAVRLSLPATTSALATLADPVSRAALPADDGHASVSHRRYRAHGRRPGLLPWPARRSDEAAWHRIELGDVEANLCARSRASMLRSCCP